MLQRANIKEIREITKQYNKENGKDKIKRNKNEIETWRSFVMFGGTTVTEGGWCERKWMTAKEMNKAQDRWVASSFSTGKEEPDVKDNWIPHQCGGCRTFAALDLDYGICCNEKSPNDGRITFEHGGCKFHSFYEGE